MAWPKYTTLKYYYSDKTTSEKYESRYWKHKNKALCASLILTKDGKLYLNQANGSIAWLEDYHTYPDWISTKGIKYAIEFQPYDFDDTWSSGRSMYSKELWRLALQDIRDFKIKLINGEIDLDKLEWYG